MAKTNVEIATILRKIAFLLEIEIDKISSENGMNFKIRAYNRAADQIENLSIDIETLYKNEGITGLLNIPQIGKTIALKIDEYVNTGEIDYFNQLQSKLPILVEQFIGLEGIGPKTLKPIFKSLNITNLSELEKAARNGRIQEIPGYSKKKEEAILKKIELSKTKQNRYLIGDIYPLVKQIERYLNEQLITKKVVIVGSFRRMKETVGDIDLLVMSDNSKKIIELFVNMPQVKEVLSQGVSKAFVKLNNGIDADLLVVSEESYGAASLYFTGSKEHGIALRRIAQLKGLRLNEWGLYDINSNQKIAGKSEVELYNKLGLEWIPPEMRENKGELELAKDFEKSRTKFLNLVKYNDLKGDLQVHSSYTDGKLSIEEMAYFAREFGLEYIAISDHTKSLKIARGLDEEQLLHQVNEIQVLNDKIKNDEYLINQNNFGQFNVNRNELNYEKYDTINSKSKFKVLSSAEVNILKDGSLDISNNILDKLDIVGAAIHTNFSLPIEIQTDRLIKAAKNPSVDIIFHPTGRIINKRIGYPVDIDKLLKVAGETKTILEIDAHYNRLDLKDDFIRMAVDNNIKLVIDSDSHHPIHFAFLKFGIAQARRGWAEKKDIQNTLSSSDLLKNLK